MLRQKLSERFSYNSYQTTPRSSQHNLNSSEKPFLSEWKLAAFGLVLSLLVIAAKVFAVYHDDIKGFVIETRLVSYDVITEDGQKMFQYAWKNVIRFSDIWLPALCGCLVTYFTWLMVYLDSHVPGIEPPSPLSPTKYKARSGHQFHLNYIFAIVIGILVSSYMYWKNVSIQF